MNPRRLHSATALSIATTSAGMGGLRLAIHSARMPIYEYRCDNGHVFEVMQKMTDDPVSTCTNCEAPVQRVFHPVAVHFKGKGFYNTDYGTKRRNREAERSGSAGGGSGDSSKPEGAGTGSGYGSDSGGDTAPKPASSPSSSSS